MASGKHIIWDSSSMCVYVYVRERERERQENSGEESDICIVCWYSSHGQFQATSGSLFLF